MGIEVHAGFYCSWFLLKREVDAKREKLVKLNKYIWVFIQGELHYLCISCDKMREKRYVNKIDDV